MVFYCFRNSFRVSVFLGCICIDEEDRFIFRQVFLCICKQCLVELGIINAGFIAFTTTNPGKRYIRLSNVKGNNNLRDFYYRDIVLGEQSEQVYNPTNNFEIALAFREAGEVFGS